MKFNLTCDNVGKDKDGDDMYHVKFTTYNGIVEGKFEKSKIRHIIEILDNAIL
jgi:hypothetical protein